jgi:LEA14-like dessication related protein
MGKGKAKKANMRKLLLVAGVIVAVYYFRTQLKRITLGGTSTIVYKFNLQQVELRTVQTILNESNASIDVQNFLGQVLYNKSPLGVTTLVKPVTIPGFSQANIEFATIISTTAVGLEFYQEILNLIQNQPTTIDWKAFTIKGTLKAEGLSIPINEKLIA